MTALHEATGRRRRTLVFPAPEESVHRPEFQRSEFQHPEFQRTEFQRTEFPRTEAQRVEFQRVEPGIRQDPLADTPIYRALLQQWAGKGRTLPGHRDPEWSRLAVPMVQRGQFGSTIPFSAVRCPE